MKYETIICDASNLYWRSIVTCLKKTLEVDDVKINAYAIQEFIDRMNELIDEYGYKTSKVYLLFDNPKHTINIRKMIDENYKHTRADKKVPEAFWDTLAILQEILKVYSNQLIVMKSDHCEADDLVYPILKRLDKSKNTLLISADMDWSRGMSESETTHWFNYHTLYNSKELFKKKFGFNPETNKVKIYKSIRGDNSDCIVNAIPHLPETILLKVVNTYDDIDIMLSKIQYSDIATNWKIKFKEAENQIRINYQLVDFVEITNDTEVFEHVSTENIGALKYWYSCLDMSLENRMFDKNKDKTSFFEMKKHKRLKRF